MNVNAPLVRSYDRHRPRIQDAADYDGHAMAADIAAGMAREQTLAKGTALDDAMRDALKGAASAGELAHRYRWYQSGDLMRFYWGGGGDTGSKDARDLQTSSQWLVRREPRAGDKRSCERRSGGGQPQIDPEEIEGQALKLFQFLRRRKHYVRFETLTRECDCWRVAEPEPRTIASCVGTAGQTSLNEAAIHPGI
ncbi:MAG: hypothetical protein R3C05_06720 [Pirellulaceae bacterium]